ncbi:MAG: hypothetical protein ACXWYO_07410 [Gaiellaceae bacterium]
MRRLFLCCAVLVVALTPLACGGDETSSTTSGAPSISTPAATGGGGGDTSALPSDPCGVISPVAFSAVFPDGVPVGEVIDDANSVCEYRSAEIGGPSVRVAIITPERVRSTAETARRDGSNPVTDLADIGDEAYLIEGVRIFTNVDGTAGGGGTRGATLGVVAGDVGIWITSTDAAAIQQLGIAAVDDLG